METEEEADRLIILLMLGCLCIIILSYFTLLKSVSTKLVVLALDFITAIIAFGLFKIHLEIVKNHTILEYLPQERLPVKGEQQDG